MLEYHHLDPRGKGGPASVKNIALFCRAPNFHAAVGDYGWAFMQRFMGAGSAPGQESFDEPLPVSSRPQTSGRSAVAVRVTKARLGC